MVKHPAWAAAINSSGLVPFSFSKRVLKEYGVSASTPESVERFPLPARPVPRQTALALRIMLQILAVVSSKISQISCWRRCSADTPPIVVEPIAEADIEYAEYDRLPVSPLHPAYGGADFGLDW